MAEVPERWDEMGAQALYDLDTWLTTRRLDRYPGDAEHVQAHAVLSTVLADLRREVERWQKAQHAEAVKQMNETMAAYMYGASRAYGDVLDLLNTRGSDG